MKIAFSLILCSFMIIHSSEDSRKRGREDNFQAVRSANDQDNNSHFSEERRQNHQVTQDSRRLEGQVKAVNGHEPFR